MSGSISGMDFAIYGGQGLATGTGLIIVLLREDHSWSSIKVTYFASGRSDFVVGSFSAALYFMQSTSTNGILTYPYSVPGWTPQSLSFSSIIEIAGIKIDATNFVVTLTSTNFNSASGLLTVGINVRSAPPIESLVITFIAYRSQTITMQEFAIASGTSDPYQFIGIDRLTAGSTVLAGYSFSSSSQRGVTCIGSRCSSTCITGQACRLNRGTLTSTACYLCGTGYVPGNGQCVRSSSCGANMHVSGGACVCNTNYFMLNGVCYFICAPNAIVRNR